MGTTFRTALNLNCAVRFELWFSNRNESSPILRTEGSSQASWTFRWSKYALAKTVIGQTAKTNPKTWLTLFGPKITSANPKKNGGRSTNQNVRR